MHCASMLDRVLGQIQLSYFLLAWSDQVHLNLCLTRAYILNIKTDYSKELLVHLDLVYIVNSDEIRYLNDFDLS